MSPPTRRQFLTLAGASVGALAGCSSLGSDCSTVALGGVSLVNTTASVTTFHLAVEHDGETAYRESHEVPAAADGRREPTTRTVVPDLPGRTDTVAVRGRVGDRERRIEFTGSEFDGERVLPSFVWQKFAGELGTTVVRVADLDDPPAGVDCGTQAHAASGTPGAPTGPRVPGAKTQALFAGPPFSR